MILGKEAVVIASVLYIELGPNFTSPPTRPRIESLNAPYAQTVLWYILGVSELGVGGEQWVGCKVQRTKVPLLIFSWLLPTPGKANPVRNSPNPNNLLERFGWVGTRVSSPQSRKVHCRFLVSGLEEKENTHLESCSFDSSLVKLLSEVTQCCGDLSHMKTVVNTAAPPSPPQIPDSSLYFKKCSNVCDCFDLNSEINFCVFSSCEST